MMKAAKKFFLGALIGVLGQTFIFFVVIVPIYVAATNDKQKTYLENYSRAFFETKEIYLIILAVAAVCWGIKEMIRVEE